jgi:hypothetical protein
MDKMDTLNVLNISRSSPMKMQDTRYMMGLIPFQAYVNLPIQNRIALREGEKKILNFIILDTFL